MRFRILLMPIAIVIAVGCNGPLDVTPTGTVPTSTAITDAPSARAAIAGVYNGLQSTRSYGEELVEFGDLSADNAENSGTYTSYLEADRNDLHANNQTVYDIWEQSYDIINRTNNVIDKVPLVPGMDPDEQADIVGQAYFVRALMYHNLVKYFGDVPIRLHAATSVNEGKDVTRAPKATVYTQILKDLDSAQAAVSQNDDPTLATPGAVLALRARVLFYQADYTDAATAAQAVEGLDGPDGTYDLAPNYGDLFSPTGNSTSEDIFKVRASQLQESFLSYDYSIKALGGVYELRPTLDLLHAYDPAFDVDTSDLSDFTTTDTRGQWNIGISGSRVYGNKYRSITGTEFFPVLRLAEIILINAESEARTGHVPDAILELNRIRARADVPPFVQGVLSTQQVVDTIVAERRKELAFEGDRWNDLNRLGITAAVMNAQNPPFDPNQALYPIPQLEIDVTPGLTQNPGY
jgi:hypothetical protein